MVMPNGTKGETIMIYHDDLLDVVVKPFLRRALAGWAKQVLS